METSKHATQRATQKLSTDARKAIIRVLQNTSPPQKDALKHANGNGEQRLEELNRFVQQELDLA